MNRDLHKYECSIHLVQYGKNDYEYEGHVNLMPNIVGSGKTYQEALNEIYSNLEAYIEHCIANSIKFPNPDDKEGMFNLSGRVTVRFPKNLHYALNEYAKKDGMSLNSIIIDATREYITRKQLMNNIEDTLNPIIEKLQLNKTPNLFIKEKTINKKSKTK